MESGGETVFELRQGAVKIGDRAIWSGVDLAVTAGEFVALLGPNGAGKSTLIKVLLGLVRLDQGRLSLPGQPRERRLSAARRTRRGNPLIGYLPQRRSFDARIRVRGSDIVRLGVDGHRWGIPLPGARLWSARARDTTARVAEVIALVGAEKYAHRPIGELSGGEQQRLLIAQALAARPRLLLLDEPLDSLDQPTQAAIAALIAEICGRRRVAVLLVTHDVRPFLGYLDRVVQLTAAGVHDVAS